jgi:prepilin-type N-terminal cleavage/methylation domain-containing protein
MLGHEADQRSARAKAGFTLVEVMVAIGLSGILITTIASLMMSVGQETHALIDGADFENDMDRLEYLIERQMRLAVNLTYVGSTSINSNTLGTKGLGYMRAFDSTALANTNTTVNAIALYYRETAHISTSVATLRSSFAPTGVYFQQPSATTYGVLYIDPGTGAGQTALAPSLGLITLTPLTGVVINASDFDLSASSGVSFVKSFKMTVYSRVASSTLPGLLAWCPPAAMGTSPCVSAVPYKDLSRTFTVKLRDNVDPNSPQLSTLLMGRLYFLN